MGRCPRPHCHGNTFLKFDGIWFEHCLLCDRDFPVIVNGVPNPAHYIDIPASTSSPMMVRYKPVKSYRGNREE